MLNIHGNPTNEQDADSIYSKAAGSANTEAKFAKALGCTTYPVELSEFGRLETYADVKIWWSRVRPQSMG